MSSRNHPTGRTLAACTVAVGVAATLTGCLGDFGQPGADGTSATPTAASGAAADCTPESATIFWNEKTDLGETNVGAYVFPFTEDGQTGEAEAVDLNVETEFTNDGLNKLTDFDADARESWEIALLEDARRTGQVDRDFGDPIALAPLPTSSISLQNPGTAGTGVQVVGKKQTQMPFEVVCVGADSIKGTITAVVDDFMSNTFFVCGEYPEPATVQSKFAEELCSVS